MIGFMVNLSDWRKTPDWQEKMNYFEKWLKGVINNVSKWSI